MNKINLTKRYSLYILMTFIFMSMSSVLWAQKNIPISGVVLDDMKEPVIGASVIIKNTTTGTVTDIDGKYKIDAPSNGILCFSYVGYETKEEKINNRTTINVALNMSSQMIDDIVVIGYGTQKKASLTGSVAGVKGSDMVRTKNENPQNMLTGRIAGVRVWQKSAEPGTYANSFDIRGMVNPDGKGGPLVIIDGVPRTAEDFQRLNSNDIEDVSVLKDGAAAIYGLRAANGVVLVSTKKGKEGQTEINYNGSFTFQKPSNMPTLADPYQAMTLYNEKSRNNVNGGNVVFTEKDFEDFRNGTRRTTDWNGLLFSDFAPQTQHDISLAGGTEKTKYFVSFGYFFQEGFFKSGDLNYNKYNLRSNISSKLTKGLTFDLNINGVADERNAPYSSSVDIIRNYWRQGVLFPAYADPENTMLNYDGLDMEENAIAMMNSDVSGHRQWKQKNFQSSASLTLDFGDILPVMKGLTAKGLFNFDYRRDDNEAFRKEYYQYAFDPKTGIYNQKLFNLSSPNRLLQQSFEKQQLLGQFTLNYNRTFNDKHNVGGLIGWEMQKNDGNNYYAQRDLAFGIPYLFAGVDKNQVGGMFTGENDLYELASESFIGRLNYAYDSRYLIEAQFRYDGSSKFAKGNQWGFFPSVSAGWRISEEPFFRSANGLSFINQLKLRASYGVMGDDGLINYEWLMGYKYPSSNSNWENGYYNQYAPGYIFGDQFIFGVDPLPLPNQKLSWATSKTFDVGFDFEAWNGLFGMSFDYFNRHRSGLFERRKGEFPTVVGSTAPLENLDSDRQIGLDLELSHRNRIADFSYNVKGIATITRRKHLKAYNKGPYANSYDQWRNNNLSNRYQGVQFGYESAGRYENWNDIWSYPVYKEKDLLPGDYKYVDWNGDGEINGQDEHPFAFDQSPWMNYSLSFDGTYKNFDMSFLFQGSALGSMQYQEPLYAIWGKNGGGTLKQFWDRWHTVDPNADPYDPATEWKEGYYAFTGHSPISNSEFNRVSTAYLRLKSIELGYTLPKLNAMKTMRLRVFANAYNVFTITGVKFVDPEHPDDDLGRMYPLNRTFTLGLQLTL
ncbi:MAG: TonB-dependent receptor [Bacteroidales bacterium]